MSSKCKSKTANLAEENLDRDADKAQVLCSFTTQTPNDAITKTTSILAIVPTKKRYNFYI